MSAIRGKVAEMIDSRELIINRGSEDGVIEGMRFAILSDATYEVLDPDDKERVLGEIPVTKTIVKVTEVQPHMSRAKTFRTIPGSPGVFAFGRTESRVEEFSIASDQQTFMDTLSDEDLAVRVGDVAEQHNG